MTAALVSLQKVVKHEITRHVITKIPRYYTIYLYIKTVWDPTGQDRINVCHTDI